MSSFRNSRVYELVSRVSRGGELKEDLLAKIEFNWSKADLARRIRILLVQ